MVSAGDVAALPGALNAYVASLSPNRTAGYGAIKPRLAGLSAVRVPCETLDGAFKGQSHCELIR